MSDNKVYDFRNVAVGDTDDAVDDTRERGPSVLDRLRAEVSKKVRRQEIFIEVPERAGVSLRISPNITQEQIKRWRKQAGEGSKDGFNPTAFACAVVGGTTRGIFINGEEAFAANGAPLGFASPEVLEMTSAARPIPEAVQAFFGLDPHVEAAALVVMEHAGYTDTVETAEDPTKKS